MGRGALAVAVVVSILASGVFSTSPARADDPSASWLPTAIRSAIGGAPLHLVRQDGKAPKRIRRFPIPPLPVRKSDKAAAAVSEPDVWPEKAVEQALASCQKLLKRVDAVLAHEPPLKQGKCGSPAPVRLTSLGGKNKVSFSPPALVDCRMVAALDRWMKQSVQPLAKKHLGEPIAKVSVMSDYSCRRSTGRRNRWSQHAFVDALDIRGFVTASGRKAYVLAGWGETQRDVAARIAAAKAKAELEKKEAEARAAGKDAVQNAKTDADDDAIANPTKSMLLAARLGGPDGVKKKTAKQSELRNRALVASLGRDVPPAAVAQDAPPPPESKFLRAAHKAACGIFGTTLGPEANEAHRNHFHVDMAERKYKKICD
jgi:hypothetical protein